MSIPKKIRQQVYDKCQGHCAYCGKEIAYKDMQVDHVIPMLRGFPDWQIKQGGWQRGTDTIDNMLPACRSCNFRKGTFDVEDFRQQIAHQCDSLCKTFQGRMSLAYGLIMRIDKPIVFYFEKLNLNNGNNE